MQLMIVLTKDKVFKSPKTNLEIQNSISITEYEFGKTLSFHLFINVWMATETQNTFKLK